MSVRTVWDALCPDKWATETCDACGGDGISRYREDCYNCDGAGWNFTPQGEKFVEFIHSEFRRWLKAKEESCSRQSS